MTLAATAPWTAARATAAIAPTLTGVRRLGVAFSGGVDSSVTAALLAPAHLARLARSAWPGNVRELRNHVERSVVLDGPEQLSDASVPAARLPTTLAYADARRHAIDAFERAYLGDVLREHGGKVAAAAKTAGIARVYFYRLLQRHGLK